MKLLCKSPVAITGGSVMQPEKGNEVLRGAKAVMLLLRFQQEKVIFFERIFSAVFTNVGDSLTDKNNFKAVNYAAGVLPDAVGFEKPC